MKLGEWVILVGIIAIFGMVGYIVFEFREVARSIGYIESVLKNNEIIGVTMAPE